MALALTSSWRRAAMAGISLLALGACETDVATDAAPSTTPIVERTDRVANEIARGQQALSNGDLSTAQAAFTAALRGSPNDPEPAMGLAETYLAIGDYKTAGRLFDLIANNAAGSDEGRLLQGRGLVALGQGESDEAVRLLERSVERNPGLWRAWAGLGRAYGRQGRTHQARTAFARAEDAAPVRALVINDVGMLHLEENDPAAALEAFQRALAIDPANTTASANARIARAMLGNYDAAVSGARPDELPNVLNNVGYIAIVNGDFEVADRLLRRAVELSPVYHEAASANLDLLAQAMKGVPVLATAGRGVSTPHGTTDTELSSLSGDTLKGEEQSAPKTSTGVAELAMGDTPSPDSAAEPEAVLASPAVNEIVPAPEPLASAPQASALTLAHGFRWESPPISAKKKRKRRQPAPAAGPSDGDPRTVAWPVIAPSPELATPEATTESLADIADPSARGRAGTPADSSAAAPGQPDAWEAATLPQGPEQQAAESAGSPAVAAPGAAATPKEPGLPE